MRRNILISVFLLVLTRLFSQGFNIELLVQNLPDMVVYLSSYYKSEFIIADSTKSVNGSFYFHKTTDDPHGMYRLDFGKSEHDGKNIYIEFVWSEESFQIFADYSDIAESVVFENSDENKLLNDFRSYEILYEEKMSAIFPLIDRYPENDNFYREAELFFIKLQEERDSLIMTMVNDHPDLFASDIIRSYRSGILSPDLRGIKRMNYLQQHFFDVSPINNPEILYAPVYNLRIIEYLKLYRNPNFTFSDQENAFIHAVDIIMANTSGDPELRSFVVDYLLEGFESFNMEMVQTYIVDTYVDETCQTDVVELAYQRVLGYRKMAEGQIASDIDIRSSNGKMVKLSEIDSEYALVLFWASYCEHCEKMMPKLREWYTNERPTNLEIFAISIDTAEYAWRNYLQRENPPWINALEPAGWSGKSPEDYNVYGTPSMFLLDRKRKILAKPYTLRELRREVGKLEKQ